MPLLVVCFSCQGEGESQAAGLPGETVPEVSVMTVRSTQVPVTANLPGRMEAYLQAEVRARVTGIIQERCYQEGQTVRPGDLLFKIDPAPLQAVLDECKAAVARARAVLSDAEDKAARYSSLVAKGAVSIREHKQARAEEERARAEYAAAAASLEQARLNLEYTRVEAPISGRVRRALVTEGAFANQNEFTHLTTIEQIDPIYVRFSQPASQYSSLRRAVVSGLWKGVPLGEIKVRLLLSNGEEYPHSGRIIFSDMAVDPNTDTIEMRALFPNPDHELLPGAYVPHPERAGRFRLCCGAGRSAGSAPRQGGYAERSGMAGFRRPPGWGQGCRQPHDVPPPRHESPQRRRPAATPCPAINRHA